jgi:hypothetical protein
VVVRLVNAAKIWARPHPKPRNSELTQVLSAGFSPCWTISPLWRDGLTLILMKTSDIQIWDPFIFPNQDENLYYLFGTTNEDCLKGQE